MSKISGPICLLIILLAACHSQEARSPQEEVWKLENIQESLKLRKEAGDTLPHLHLDLKVILPAKWGNFQEQELESYGLYDKGTYWSEAHAVYFQSDRSFVEIYLTDLAADPAAFLHVFEQYTFAEEENDTHKKVWPEHRSGVFAWEWLDVRNQMHYLEAGISNRYHLIIRSNLPESRQLLESSWSKLAWKKLEDMEASS